MLSLRDSVVQLGHYNDSFHSTLVSFGQSHTSLFPRVPCIEGDFARSKHRKHFKTNYSGDIFLTLQVILSRICNVKQTNKCLLWALFSAGKKENQMVSGAGFPGFRP